MIIIIIIYHHAYYCYYSHYYHYIRLLSSLLVFLLFLLLLLLLLCLFTTVELYRHIWNITLRMYISVHSHDHNSLPISRLGSDPKPRALRGAAPRAVAVVRGGSFKGTPSTAPKGWGKSWQIWGVLKVEDMAFFFFALRFWAGEILPWGGVSS